MKDGKLVRLFHGPYRVLNLTPTNAEVHLVDQPDSESIFVSLSRVCLCHPGTRGTKQGDGTWTGHYCKTDTYSASEFGNAIVF